jgi:hypothetical protein
MLARPSRPRARRAVAHAGPGRSHRLPVSCTRPVRMRSAEPAGPPSVRPRETWSTSRPHRSMNSKLPIAHACTNCQQPLTLDCTAARPRWLATTCSRSIDRPTEGRTGPCSMVVMSLAATVSASPSIPIVPGHYVAHRVVRGLHERMPGASTWTPFPVALSLATPAPLAGGDVSAAAFRPPATALCCWSLRFGLVARTVFRAWPLSPADCLCAWQLSELPQSGSASLRGPNGQVDQ